MARKQMDYQITADTVTVNRLDYPNGPDGEPVVAETVTFAVGDVPAELKVNEEQFASLAAYGLSQLLQDRVSSVQGSEAKLAAMHDVFELLKNGEWKAVRASSAGERKVTIAAEFAEGFARFVQSKGKDMDAATATAFLQSKSNEERKALRAHPEVKAFIQAVKDEAVAKAGELDLGDLLG